jgi:hypothetical protein
MDECKPLPWDEHGGGDDKDEVAPMTRSSEVLHRYTIAHACRPYARGLHSFPFQLNLRSSVHRKTKADS